MLRWVCLVCYAVASVIGRDTDFSPEECAKILAKHNELRALVIPPPSNMEVMKWDDRLASMAQDWADRCIFEHGQAWPKERWPYTYLGQNIWMGTKTQTREITELIVQDWWDEINFYTYENHTCLPDMICGHYTQVATAESVYVGCGRTDCTNEDLRALIIVCDYQRPVANPILPWPYKKGSFCTECKSGSAFCENGLCAECKSPVHKEFWPEDPELKSEKDCGSETQCKVDCYNCGKLNETACRCECAPGWGGLDCSGLCGDLDPDCPKMLPPGQRVARCNPMQYDQCKQTCGRCKGLYEDSEGLCCDGRLCENGGLLDVAQCTCLCYEPYVGDHCEIYDPGNSSTKVQTSVSMIIALLLYWLFNKVYLV